MTLSASSCRSPRYLKALSDTSTRPHFSSRLASAFPNEGDKSIAEAIPPAYTRFIGGQIMTRLESEALMKEMAA